MADKSVQQMRYEVRGQLMLSIPCVMSSLAGEPGLTAEARLENAKHAALHIDAVHKAVHELLDELTARANGTGKLEPTAADVEALICGVEQLVESVGDSDDEPQA